MKDEVWRDVNDPCAFDTVERWVIWTWQSLQNGDPSEREVKGKEGKRNKGERKIVVVVVVVVPYISHMMTSDKHNTLCQGYFTKEMIASKGTTLLPCPRGTKHLPTYPVT